MQIVVIADGKNQKAFQDKEIPEGVIIQFFGNVEEAKKDGEGYFYLLGKESFERDYEMLKEITAPVFFIHQGVVDNLPGNFAIIEGWPQFLFAETVNVHYHKEKKNEIKAVLNAMKWDFHSEIQ